MFLFSLFLAPLVCPWMIWAVNPAVVARQGKDAMTASNTLDPASVYSVLQTYLVPATATSTPDTTRSNPEPTIKVPLTTTTALQTTGIPAPASNATPPTGLSIGAKVGIGVGVIGMVAVAAVAGAYLLGVRKGRRRDVDPDAGAKVLDPSNELNTLLSSRATDKPAPSGAELPTAANAVELPANRVVSLSLPPPPPPCKDAKTVPARTVPAKPALGGSGPHELPG